MTGIESAMRIIKQAQEGTVVAKQELAEAIDRVVEVTAETYTRESASYEAAREAQPWEVDEYMSRALVDLVRKKVATQELSLDSSGLWRMLDIGAGYGRDVLRFGKESDLHAVALENAPGFVAVLRERQAAGDLPPDAVIDTDMRDMASISSASFECVRNHATLHHLPVVPLGLGADAAVAESRRVLVPGGVLYVLVKKGSGIDMIDTREGLGGRFFQLFTPQLLTALLARHSFSVVHMEEFIEPRSSGDVEWLFSLSVAH